MANRRFGGGPPNKMGGGGGGYGHQQNFGGNKLNPWQGGAGPNNNMNSNAGGLLSQLSAPQAQLAIALSTLLQPQQQMSNSNPPSLLSLSTSPSFNNQDNFGPPNRFNNRGRDFRRPEPYKGRSGNSVWRDNSTRPTDSYGGGGGGRSQNRSNSRPNSNFNRNNGKGGGGKFNRNNTDNKQAASGTAASNKSSVSTANSTPAASAAEKAGNESLKIKEESVANNSANDDGSRDEESCDKETKRDWKEEKNNAEGNNVENGTTIKKESVEDGGDLQKDKKPREGRYVGVPSSLLNCFVCNKSMWDGESFQNHLRGKAHKQMMDSLGQSFQITVNILRENMRLVEEKKMIELERMSRNNRAFHRQQQEPQSHCNMCDLKFLGKIIAHRKTEGHQRLKRFLHPKCEHCSQEFPSRMEWVDHRFTPDHLRKVAQVLEGRIKDEDGVPTLEEEEPEIENDPLLEESLQTEDENPILELSDDLKDLQNRLPSFKPNRPVGKESLQPAQGFYCEVCVRFIEESQKEPHLLTERHYQCFVEAAKLKYKKQTEEKEAEERNAKKRQAEEDGDGDFEPKKVKIESEEDGKKEEKKATPGAAVQSDTAAGGDEMYDPEEACKEGEVSLDTVALEEEFAEVDRLIQSASEESTDNPKPAAEQAPAVQEKQAATPVAAAAAPTKTPAVRGRNNAGGPARGGAANRGRRGRK